MTIEKNTLNRCKLWGVLFVTLLPPLSYLLYLQYTGDTSDAAILLFVHFLQLFSVLILCSISKFIINTKDKFWHKTLTILFMIFIYIGENYWIYHLFKDSLQNSHYIFLGTTFLDLVISMIYVWWADTWVQKLEK
ncbi:hypothetical protein [Lonepinella sp. BR2474]|uniref:hypothetical protein n=1 Tax=Lonepinella sp. BR2474 TaxID=3434548 RepID=UPI003F6E3A2D